MNKTSLLTALALSLFVGAAAQAGERTFGDGTLPDHMVVFDVDESGALSIEEVQAMREGRLDRHREWLEQWDTNGDGVIDEAERAAAREALRARIEARRTERFNEADTDGNGCLDFDEFSAIPAVQKLAEEHPDAPARIFDRLDANDDDCVSLEEFLARLHHRRDRWRTPETFERADENNDECLSLVEFSAIPQMVKLAEQHPEGPARIYNLLNKDGDDCLTLEEFTADIHLGDHGDGWRTPETYAAADDGDGCLTFEEFSAIPAMVRLAQEHPEGPQRIFNRLNTEEDTCLTLEEFTAEWVPPPSPTPLPSPDPGDDPTVVSGGDA